MTTGQRLTKWCTPCGSDRPEGDFTSGTTKYGGRCCDACVREIDAKFNKIGNKRGNAISKIAYRIAGSGPNFYQLSKEKRTEIRTLAAQLHDAGQSVSGAEAFESTNKNGFVYVIRHRHLEGIKIGRACNPEARLRGYQTGCPRREYELVYALYFEDCYAAESALHVRLNAHQLAGEWFDIQADEGQEAIEAFARQLTHQSEATTNE